MYIYTYTHCIRTYSTCHMDGYACRYIQYTRRRREISYPLWREGRDLCICVQQQQGLDCNNNWRLWSTVWLVHTKGIYSGHARLGSALFPSAACCRGMLSLMRTASRQGMRCCSMQHEEKGTNLHWHEIDIDHAVVGRGKWVRNAQGEQGNKHKACISHAMRHSNSSRDNNKCGRWNGGVWKKEKNTCDFKFTSRICYHQMLWFDKFFQNLTRPLPQHISLSPSLSPEYSTPSTAAPDVYLWERMAKKERKKKLWSTFGPAARGSRSILLLGVKINK